MQSVALRIIADREEEINAFIPEEYWSLDAVFKIRGKRNRWLQSSTEKKKRDDDFFQRRSGKDHERTGRCILSVSEVKKGERSKKAPLPFTTSTLQGGFQGTEFFHAEDDASGTAVI